MEEGVAIIERAQPPSMPLMDGTLQARLVHIVSQDLFDWRRAARLLQQPVTPPGSEHRCHSLEDLVTEFHIQQKPQSSTGLTLDHDKLPSKIWRGTINLLLWLTQKSNKEALPSIWHSWANCKKEKEECRAVLQDHFCKMAWDLKLPKPVATVDLTNLLYTLAFMMAPLEDKLQYGVQPFAVTYLSQKYVTKH